MASAISAPVLPQEIATVEAPSRTEVSAFHMLEPSARRSAREGFSSISMTLSAWRTSVRSASGVPGRIVRFRRSASPWAMKRRRGFAFSDLPMPRTTTRPRDRHPWRRSI